MTSVCYSCVIVEALDILFSVLIYELNFFLNSFPMTVRNMLSGGCQCGEKWQGQQHFYAYFFFLSLFTHKHIKLFLTVS